MLRLSQCGKNAGPSRGAAFFLFSQACSPQVWSWLRGLVLSLLVVAVAAGCSRAVPGNDGVDGCIAPPGLRDARIAKVVDGDTVHLKGGERVRLIGINTPEMGRDGRRSQPLADEASRALGELLEGGSVLLQAGTDARDRHGRLLAHLFTPAGDSVEAHMLRQGLAFHVAISPNLAHLECFKAAEQLARQQRLGVWSDKTYRPRPVASLGRDEGGFSFVSGTVSRVSFKNNGWWVQLDGKLGLRIDGEDQYLFQRQRLQALQGRSVIVRGWLVPMDGWWQMKLSHPSMMEVGD